MGDRSGDRPTGRRGERQLSVDETFALLSDARRRFVLAYLHDRQRVTFDELADVVTGWVQSRRGDTIATGEQRDRTAARLHHVDLPKLAAAGTLDYDYRRGQVVFVGLPEPIDEVLAIAEGWQARQPGDQEGATSRRR